MSVPQHVRAVRERVRTGDRADVAFAVAFLLGLLAPVVHWSGLVVGGALVGLVAPTVRRALLTGIYLGVAVVVAFCLFLFVTGALGPYLSMGVVLLASVGLGIAVPTLAAGAARGLT